MRKSGFTHYALRFIPPRLCYTLCMRRRFAACFVYLLCVALLAGCDVPTPPPELPTPTPGSGNPENPLSQLALTQVVPTPPRDFAPLNAPTGHIYFVRQGNLWRVEPDGT